MYILCKFSVTIVRLKSRSYRYTYCINNGECYVVSYTMNLLYFYTTFVVYFSLYFACS